MLLKELIGKTITNIFELVNYELGGLDKGECFVELNGSFIIDIPYGFENSESRVWIKKLDETASTIFKDLDKLSPVYHANKVEKSIKKIADKYTDRKPTLLEKLKYLINGQKTVITTKQIKEYEPYKVEYIENKLKHIKDRAIEDLITFGGDLTLHQ